MMEKDARFRAKFDQVNIGYALIDSNTGALIKVNKKFCDIVGLERNSFEGISFMDIAHPDDLHSNLKNMQELLEGGLSEYTMEKNFLHKDGSHVFCTLNIASLWELGEEPKYHLAIIEDHSERKIAEYQLQKMNDLLGQRIQDLTAELEMKTSELEASRLLLKEEVAKLVAEKQ